ncbi:hypothetical protein VTI74DRAFT_9667 [Chaetomium olivicolor]
MPISPLPESTVRRLGSTLVITSPVLLFKELLDNATDSGATSIDVLVSPNTTDKIEVRDNGHGINPDDYESLGRPGHTSKLRSFNELGSLGGRTLGFRGTALASANTLGDVTVTTRVPTEHVATVISLAKGGGVQAQRHVGAPVGTVVCVTSLFAGLPVRLQITTKEAPKNLAKMKELLQTYALTRPSVKLRFSVLGTPILSWSYAPAPNGGIKEAAMQLFGTELASQCVFEMHPNHTNRPEAKILTTDGQHRSSSEQEVVPIFEALLPRPGADLRKLSKGSFLSVDSRPVASARGTAKKLLSIFKQHLEHYFGQLYLGDVPRDPFIRLNIRCPPGYYDVNVELSKDNVLFKDERAILDQFDTFLSLVYSVVQPPDDSPQPPASAVTRETNVPNLILPEASNHSTPAQETTPPWRVDMSTGLDGMSDDGCGSNKERSQRQGRQEETGEDPLVAFDEAISEDNKDQPSKEGLNPWSIAKLTGTSRRVRAVLNEPSQGTHPAARTRPSELKTADNSKGGVWSTAPERSLTVDQVAAEAQPRRRTRTHNPSSQASAHDHFGPGAAADSTRPLNLQSRRRYNDGLERPPISSFHDQNAVGGSQREHVRQLHGARSGRLVQSQVSFNSNNRWKRQHREDALESDHESFEPASSNRWPRGSRSTRSLDTEEANLILSPVREITCLRETVPRRTLPESALERDITPTEPHRQGRWERDTRPPTLPIDNPRVQFIKGQQLMTQNPQKKPKSLRTEQLPLEAIPCDSQTHNLLLKLPADASKLAQLFGGAVQFDTWLLDGRLKGAFKGGISAEDAARLVEPLLARVGHSRPAMT